MKTGEEDTPAPVPVEGDLEACYLNEKTSPFTGVLVSLFGRCSGGLFYQRRPPAELWKGPGYYVCEAHLSVKDEVEA